MSVLAELTVLEEEVHTSFWPGHPPFACPKQSRAPDPALKIAEERVEPVKIITSAHAATSLAR
jgi:hypothetical protein